MTKVRVTYRPDGSGRLVQEGRAASGLPRSGSEPRSGLRSAVGMDAAAGMGERAELVFAESYSPWISPFQDKPIWETAPDLLRAGQAEGDAAEEPAWSAWPGESPEPGFEAAPPPAAPGTADPESDHPAWSGNSGRSQAGKADRVEPDGAEEPEDSEEPGEWPWAAAPASGGRAVQSGAAAYEVGYDEPEAWPAGPIVEPDAARPARAGGIGARMKRASGTGGGAGPSWLAVLLSIGGAIATGAVLGYMTLTLFAGQGLLPAREGQAADASAAAEGGLAEPAASSAPASAPAAEAAQGAAKVQSVAAGWPERTYQLLQYGVFSSKGSAEAAAAELKKAGLAAALRHDGDYRVYAGVASSRGQAEKLAAGMTGTEVYLKEMKLPSVSELAFAGTAEQLKAYDEGAADLIGDLAGQTSALLAGDAAGMDAASRAAWAERLDGWLKNAAAVEPAWSGKAAQEAAGALADALRQAGAKLTAYGESPQAERLWAVQAELTAAALAQLQLREAAVAG